MLLLIVWLLASLSTFFFFFSNPTFHIQKVDSQCKN